MNEYVKKTFKDLELPRGGVLAGASFEQCVFDGCNVRGGVGPYGIVRNVEARKCKFKSTEPFDTILEDVTIEDLDTGGGTLTISNCLFKHVVLKGKFDKWFVRPTSHAQMDAEKYYASVDWALDLREAEFKEIDLRGIPVKLLRRDPEVQVIVYGKDAARVPGWKDLPYSTWSTAIERVTGEDAARTHVVLIPAKRGKGYAEQIASAKKLHALGLAK
jgi:hypothetical protein